MKRKVYIKVCGEVIGVGFRSFIRELAGELGVVGYARNLDGEVVAEAEGEEEILVKFLEGVRQGPRWAKIERLEEEWGEAEGIFRGFEIIY